MGKKRTEAIKVKKASRAIDKKRPSRYTDIESGRQVPSGSNVQEGVAVLKTSLGKPERWMTAVEKMNLSIKGVSKKDLEHFKSKAGLDYDKLAEVLAVARATLINKKGSQRFNSALSERIVALGEIYSYGYEVFESAEYFNNWVFKPNQSLAGKIPFDLLNNTFGREEIKNLIGRIDYGVYS